MATSNLEIREVESFLKNKGIAISYSNTWLRSCVECFRTQCSNYRIKDLLDFVFEQWLLADLREIRSGSLPKECCTSEKFTVVGKHAVQLNYCVDISTPSYLQFQKIRRPDFGENLNIECERDLEGQTYSHTKTGRRSLKLEISDGQLTVIGFEDKSIPCLRNPVPGEKALLKGPIECRKGVLMLTDKNIEVFGGEVDTLLIPNAVGNVLARLLGQPEDPNPYKQHIEADKEGKILDCLDEDNEALILLAESMEKSEANFPLTNSNVESISNMDSATIDDSLDFDDEAFDLVAAQTASMAEAEADKQRRQDSLLGNSKRESTLINTLYSAEQTAHLKISSGPITNSTNSPDSVEYIDMNDPKRLKRELEESYGSGSSYNKPQTTSLISSGQAQSSRNVSNNDSSQITSSPYNKSEIIRKIERNPNLSVSFNNNVAGKVNTNKKDGSDISKQNASGSLKEINPVWPRLDKHIPPSSHMGNNLNNVGGNPFCRSQESEHIESDLSEPEPEYISDDNSETFHQPYPPRKFPALRVVHGQVIRLSEKLTLKDNEWCLSAIVSAKGLEIQMNFASEVLDKLFGVTAVELKARKNVLKTDPAAKEQMNKLLRDSQLRIKNLNCEMVIQFPSVTEKPVIIDVVQK